MSYSDFYDDKKDSWRETFIRLDDKHFLTIMRLYLGEVKTPYNKQKLLEQLEGFLRREETQKNIVALLSKQDIAVLSAIKFIPNATLDNLRDFFGNDFIEERFTRHLQELKTRLLIYEDSSGRRYDSCYKITPLLEKALDGVLKAQTLFPAYEPPASESNSKSKKVTPSPVDCISIELVAAFLSYIAKNESICKLDGTFKKRAEDELKEKFPNQLKRLRLLSRAFVNLGLVKEIEGGFELNWNQLESFAELETSEQLVYLLAAIPTHSSKERTRVYAKIFLNALNAIPKSGFKDSVFLSYAYLMSVKNSVEYYSYSRPSRFSKIVNSYNSQGDTQNEPDTLNAFFERMLDNAESLGIITTIPVYKDKTDDPKNPLYKVIFQNPNFFKPKPASKEAMIKIDGAFNITLMQGFCFEKILPLVKFADIVKFDTASQFEVNKDSIIRSLDVEMDSKKVLLFLKDKSGFAVPEALEVSIKEWEEAYKSISIYKGFVIRLDKKSAPLAERNSILKQHIYEQLAPGIFLLDIEDESRLERVLKRCGIENTGKIKTPQKEKELSEFSSLESGSTLFEDDDSPKSKGTKKAKAEKEAEASPITPPNAEKALQNLFKEIDALKLSDEQKDTLRDIAASKLLVSSSQLKPPALSAEKKSARGMDYQGKVHVIEQALRNKEQILFRLAKGDSLEIANLVSIERAKFQDGVYLNLIVNGEEKMYSIGRIEFVQRLQKILGD